MSSNRNFPQTIEQSDVLVARYPLPTIPGYTDFPRENTDAPDSYEVTFSLVGDGSADERTFPATIGSDAAGDYFLFTIGTDDWPPGAWHWRIRGRWERSGVQRQLTFCRGFVVVVVTSEDEAMGSTSHARTMVFLLREILRMKLEGSSDVIEYEIGGRSVRLMSVEELQRALSRYEQQLTVASGGRVRFDSGAGFPET